MLPCLHLLTKQPTFGIHIGNKNEKIQVKTNYIHNINKKYIVVVIVHIQICVFIYKIGLLFILVKLLSLKSIK